MAKDDQRSPVVVQFIQVLRDRLHGDQPRAFDPANGVLFRLPNIYQAQALAVVKAAFYIAGTNFQGNFGHDEMLAIGENAKRAPRRVRLTPLLYSGVQSSVSNRFNIR